jgi:hypothetical protein
VTPVTQGICAANAFTPEQYFVEPVNFRSPTRSASPSIVRWLFTLWRMKMAGGSFPARHII